MADLKDFMIKMSLGSLSCMMPLPVLNPVEVIKIRLQLQGEGADEKGQSAARRIYGSSRKYRGMTHAALQIVREEGLGGLYKGLLPALMREAIYAGFRMGAYDPLKQLLGAVDGADFPLWKKLICGAVAGTVGAAVATPTDVMKVRMQADCPAPGQPPRYRNTWDAFTSILRNEGVRGLWSGVGPTTQRAAVISAAMMPSYDHSKHLLLKYHWFEHDSVYVHACAAMVAGFLMTLVSSPIDVVKTRIMNERAQGRHYQGAFACFLQTVRQEGFLGLYKGFMPAYMRLGPHTLTAFLLFEKLRSLVGYKPV